MSAIYRRFGVRTVINASGTQTRSGGTIMDPEILKAMTAAAKHFVRIEELQTAAGRVIASATGAEDGYVTSGASAGITMAVAAAIAGLDLDKMDRLPDTTGMKNEVIVQRAHRNAYDHAALLAGVRFVEVGTLGFPGRGATWAWQVEAAITERTAAILCPVMDAPGTVSLPEVCRIAHRHRVPVIVDAAGALPPVSNLRRFIAEGADVVLFSGGKAIGGPQTTGIVAGRADLIESMALQHQDMDVYPQTWSLRRKYLDSGVLPGPPHHGIGRGFKVGKEEVIGLLVALERYLARDHDADFRRWQSIAETVVRELDGIGGVRTEIFTDPGRPVPQARIHLDEAALKLSAFDLVNQLAEQEPAVLVSEGLAYRGTIGVNAMALADDEVPVVIQQLRLALQSAPGNRHSART
jgi:L-seryl-tRNA(Ser) seleniumtransferase